DRRDPKFAEGPRHLRLHPGGEDPLQRQVRAGKILNVSAELKRAQAPVTAPRDTGASAAPVMIAIDHVSLTFTGRDAAQSVQALDDVSLTVRKGEFVCLLGPSGCGKSTLLSIIGGMLRPTAGSIAIAGAPVKSPRPH